MPDRLASVEGNGTGYPTGLAVLPPDWGKAVILQRRKTAIKDLNKKG